MPLGHSCPLRESPHGGHERESRTPSQGSSPALRACFPATAATTAAAARVSGSRLDIVGRVVPSEQDVNFVNFFLCYAWVHFVQFARFCPNPADCPRVGGEMRNSKKAQGAIWNSIAPQLRPASQKARGAQMAPIAIGVIAGIECYFHINQ
jgi:hypothetical protein